MIATGLSGDRTSLPLPATVEELQNLGADWLTKAFHIFGSLPPDDRVVRVQECVPVAGGNSGAKARLVVELARPIIPPASSFPPLSSFPRRRESSSDPLIQNHDTVMDSRLRGNDEATSKTLNLFVKLSRDFDDPFRDRRKYELEAEVRLAQLSQHPQFPVSVAQPYFADFHHASGTGLLIMAEIPFGTGAIELLKHKCRDYELDDALPYYRATVTALARLAGAHHAGHLAPDLEQLFPYDSVVAAAEFPIEWDEAGLRAAIGRYAALAKQAPQLFPAPIRDPDFMTRLEDEALQFLHRQSEIRAFLHADPSMIALTHWNSNLDNAWFWRENSELHCGLLDWGMVRVMNAAYGLWGGLSAAEPELLTTHLDDLLALYATEVEQAGGPIIAPETLGQHFDLALALLGLALMIDTPKLLLQRMPDIARATSPRDAMFDQDGVTRGFLHVFTNFLMVWESRQIGK